MDIIAIILAIAGLASTIYFATAIARQQRAISDLCEILIRLGVHHGALPGASPGMRQLWQDEVGEGKASDRQLVCDNFDCDLEPDHGCQNGLCTAHCADECGC